MSVQSAKARPSLAWLQYGLFLGLFLAVVVAGYFGFRAFAATPDLTVFNLYTVAVIAGVASFFSPCAFPLLPSYFSFYHQADNDENDTSSDVSKTVRLGVAASLGVITFDLVLGLVIALLGSGIAQGLSISGPEPSQFVRIFRGGVGAVLLILGVGQLLGWNLKPTFVDAFAYRTRPEREGKRKPAVNLFLYGLGYNAAGMGCTGPILAGLMIIALSSGGFATALGAFGVFSLTMGGLMLIVSGLVAASKQTLITRLKAATSKIKSAASVLLILVGVFNIYTAVNLDLFLGLLFP
jgi:cytochrome c-type biogenesis protein